MNQFMQINRTLEELIADRDQEITALQKRQADELKDVEERGRKQLDTLAMVMGADNVQLLGHMKDMSMQAADAIDAEVKDIRAKLSAVDPDELANMTQPLDLGLAPLATTALSPYYAKIYGSDGSVYWEGYNPGNLNVFTRASGSGSGIAGTGAGSFTAYIDWWFVFRPDTNRFYAFNCYVPYHGFYIVRADDAWYNSKEAKARIDLNTVAYQYNYKPGANTNVLDIRNDNINVNDRFDGWRYAYYSTLLGGGDNAYLRITSSYHVYARGGGSYSELNFSEGSANYMGKPIVYVS